MATISVKIFAYPGYLIGSEISKLVNKGYQQFLKTAKTEVPATADHLKALQQFTEELKGRPGPAHPVQRIARHGQRIVPVRPRRESRQARRGSAEASLGKGRSDCRRREKGQSLGLTLIPTQACYGLTRLGGNRRTLLTPTTLKHVFPTFDFTRPLASCEPETLLASTLAWGVVRRISDE